MRNHEIAAAFDELSDRLALQDEKPYRYMAYRAASKAFRSLGESVAQRSEAGTLLELEGVGPAIEEKVRQLLETGTFPALDKARAAVPDALLELVHIQGIGPKSAQKIYAALDGETVDSLVARAGSGELQPGDGITPKFVALLAEEAARRASGDVDPGANEGIPRGADGQPLPGPWVRRDQARQLLDHLTDELAAFGRAHDPEPSGAYVRGVELLRGVTLLATSDAPPVDAVALLAQLIAKGYEHADTAPRSPLLAGIDPGDATDLQLVTPSGIPAVVVLATAGARALASAQLPGPEAWLEHHATIPDARAVPVELRERVLAGELSPDAIPADLVRAEDLRGELHAHSDWSDGRATIGEMARAARARGDEYFLVTDHSAPYAMVGGLGEERLLAQAEEIAAVNEALAAEAAAGDAAPFRVLQGSEVEILADGALGLPDHVLERLDWVVASIHVAQRQSSEQLVERMRRVIENPLVDAIGHPTSRRMLMRQRTALPIDALIAMAVEHDVVLEINANAERLDLDSVQAAMALAAGVRLTINTDAHQTHTLDNRDHGVAVARRAGARIGDIVNCLPAAELLAGRRRLR